MTSKTKTIKDDSNVIGFRAKDVAIRKKWDKELREMRKSCKPMTATEFMEFFSQYEKQYV